MNDLKNMDADQLADLQASIAREVNRRAPKPDPSKMTQFEYQAWADQEIYRAELAAKAALEKGGAADE